MFRRNERWDIPVEVPSKNTGSWVSMYASHLRTADEYFLKHRCIDLSGKSQSFGNKIQDLGVVMMA